MITNIFLQLATIFLNFFANFLPTMPNNGCPGGGDLCVWGWPQPVYDFIYAFFNGIKPLNFIIPLGGDYGLFAALLFLISYFTLIFLPIKLILIILKRR